MGTQVVKFIDWETLVLAVDPPKDEFPVVYDFGGAAPAYMSVSAATAPVGRSVTVRGGLRNSQARAFLELNPYSWVK